MSNAVFLRPDENGNWGTVNTATIASSNMSSLLTFQSGATALGNGTAIDVSGYATLILQVTISATATVAFETSLDGINYGSVSSNSANATGTQSNTTNAAGTGFWRFTISGVKFFRARISAYTSGTVDVIGYASTTSFSPLYATSTFGAGDTNSTSTALLGVGAYNLLYDGTNWVRQRTASNDNVGNGLLPAFGAYGYNGTTWDKVRTVNTGQIVTTLRSSTGVEPRGDSTSDGSSGTGAIATTKMGWNGATFDRVRVGKVYKYIEYLNLANATATTVWTPSAGKKFRLMGVSISVSGTNSAAHLRDGAGGTIFYTVRAPGTDTKTFDFGNGYLSSAVNNVLEIYNLTGGTINVQVTAWGTEE